MTIEGFTGVIDDVVATLEDGMVTASELDIAMPPAAQEQAFLTIVEAAIKQLTDIQTTLKQELAS